MFLKLFAVLRKNPFLRLLLAANIGLLLFLTFCVFIGERFWVSALLIFLPVQVWLLIPALLAIGTLAIQPELCWVNLVAALLIFLILPKFHFHSAATDHPAIICLTNNIGQSNHQSLLPFIAAQDPDIVVLQEATHQLRNWQRAFPDRFVVEKGEFLLVSKFPIKNAAFVTDPLWHRQPVAAEFDVDVKGRTVAVYDVHMPTPRPAFAKLRGLGVLRELLGRNRRRSDNQSFSETMAARVELARQLAARIAAEQRACIILGDFNAPDSGYIYRLFNKTATDSFSEAGCGFGWTFPGYTHNPLAFFRPWLRLDYIFAGRGWKPVYCSVEPSRRSQHRAVVAHLEPI